MPWTEKQCFSALHHWISTRFHGVTFKKTAFIKLIYFPFNVERIYLHLYKTSEKHEACLLACGVCAGVYHILLKCRRDNWGLISSHYFPNIIKNLESVLKQFTLWHLLIVPCWILNTVYFGDRLIPLPQAESMVHTNTLVPNRHYLIDIQSYRVQFCRRYLNIGRRAKYVT